MSDVWEPWTPKIGQRVRIRVSAECDNGPGTQLADGNTGHVRRIDRNKDDGHFYAVLMDDPDLRWHFLDELMMCAAIELEPIEAES